MLDYAHYADLGPTYYSGLSYSDKARRIKGVILANFNGDDEARSALGRLCYSLSVASTDEEFDGLVEKILSWGDANGVYVEVCKPGAKQP